MHKWRFVLAVTLTLGLCACGTMHDPSNDVATGAASSTAAEETHNAHDPIEGFNRAIYIFNDKFDRYLLKPVAKGYRAIAPTPVRKGVSNFFGNLHDPGIMLNNLLQAKPKQAASDLGRFVINSTVGILGLFDIATKWGMEKHNEDFGQTLAKWGVGDGPYLVLPFLGPSNLRDGGGLVVDWETYPPSAMQDRSTGDKLILVEVIDKRAQLLDAGDILDQAAGQDPYIFVREAYRQRRRSQIYDGNPPQSPPDPSLFEDDPPPKSSPKPTAEKAAPPSK
ncbi:MAG: VacJ family lipoprotein [Gammaproteobacteria bacterium]|nr:VacJ family lipoprotein [Gammaproteobacteria bacterium]